MEQRVVILRTEETADTSSSLAELTRRLMRETGPARCDGEGGGGEVLRVRSSSWCVPPSTAWTSSPDLTSSQPFTLSPAGLSSLADCLHSMLDSLPAPGSSLLSLLWLCDSPPPALEPALYGALSRAVRWHSAQLSIISLAETGRDSQPWQAALRADSLPASYLCHCHGLQEFLPPSLVWRGSLAFYDETALSFLSLPGYELHLSASPTKLKGGGGSNSKIRQITRYFSGQLEVVSAVSVSDILAKPHYLSGEKLTLKTPILESDEFSDHFMSQAFSTGTGFIVKLKFSYDRPKCDVNALKTASWKQSVINCEFSQGPPCPVMGNDVDSVNLLVYHEPGLEGDCSRNTAEKSVIVLKSDLNQMYSLRHSLRQPLQSAGCNEAVLGITAAHLEDWKVLQLRRYVRKVQAHVLEVLQERESDILKNSDISDILISIQTKILADVGLTSTYSDVSSEELEELLGKDGASNNLKEDSEDCQEKRFLRYLSSCKERQDQEEQAQSKLLKPNEEDYVILEAKELLKYFDKNGLPSKLANTLEVKNKNCSVKPQKTTEEYNSMISENFDLVSSEEFCFKGFKLRENMDFSKVEFTQYHDVYYNTGVSSEVEDIERKNYRDCMVGPHRETKSTFFSDDSGPTSRIKVLSRRPPVQTTQEKKPQRRSSPSKKPAGTRQPPVRPSEGRRSTDGGKKEASRPNRRKSTGENGELTDVNTKKLREAVYDVLMLNSIEQANPLFKKCFPKLFKICKMYALEGPDE